MVLVVLSFLGHLCLATQIFVFIHISLSSLLPPPPNTLTSLFCLLSTGCDLAQTLIPESIAADGNNKILAMVDHFIISRANPSN